MNDLPILTILIPSYNRGLRVRTLVSFLLPFIEEVPGKIELVVSNNQSTDGTDELLTSFTSDFLRVHKQEEHIVSTEAHIFQCIKLCRGKYVWFLGDDDIPQLSTIRSTLEVLALSEHDFIMFNSLSVDSHGQAGCWISPSDSDLTQVDFTSGASFLGYTFCMAGISNAIMLREPLAKTDWRPLVASQLIYSHVAWWMVAFKGRRLTSINKILVHYRLDDGAAIGDRFRRYASRIGVPDLHFWTIGLVEQLKYLQSVGAISATQIYGMFELSGGGLYFRFLDNIVNMTCSQVLLSVTEDGERNRISEESLDGVTDWLLSVDPGYFDCVEVMKDIHALRRNPESNRSTRPYIESKLSKDMTERGVQARVKRLTDLFHMLAARKQSTNELIGFIGMYRGFAKYKHVTGFVAFDADSQIDRQRVLRSFTIIPMTSSIVVAADELGLMEEIRVVRGKQIVASEGERRVPHRVEIEGLRSLTDAIAVSGLSARDRNQVGRAGQKLMTVWTQVQFQFKRLRRWANCQNRAPAYFSEKFYLDRNPDVRGSGFNPYSHFRLHGIKEGRSPNPMFDATWYMRNYPEHFENDTAAFAHFLDFGLAEGRRPHPFYDAKEFKARYLSKR